MGLSEDPAKGGGSLKGIAPRQHVTYSLHDKARDERTAAPKVALVGSATPLFWHLDNRAVRMFSLHSHLSRHCLPIRPVASVLPVASFSALAMGDHYESVALAGKRGF